MKASKILVLTLLLMFGLAGLAWGRDTSDRNGSTPAASYAGNPAMYKGRRHHRRHHRRWHRRGGRHKHGGMKM